MIDPCPGVILDSVIFIEHIAHVAVRPYPLTVVVMHIVTAPREAVGSSLTANDLRAARVVAWVVMPGVILCELVVLDEHIVARAARDTVLAIVVDVVATQGDVGLNFNPGLVITNLVVF